MVDAFSSEPTKDLFSVNYGDMTGLESAIEGYRGTIDMWAESQANVAPIPSVQPSGNNSQPNPNGGDQPKMHNTQNILNNNLNVTNVRVDPNKTSNGSFTAKQDGLNGLKATVEGAKREIAGIKGAGEGPGGPAPKSGPGLVGSTVRDGAIALAADAVLPGAGTVVAAISAATTLGRGAGSFITALNGGGSSFTSAVDKGKSTPGYGASSTPVQETQTVSQNFANMFLNDGPGFGTTFSSALKDIKGIDVESAEPMIRAVENLNIAVNETDRDMKAYSNRQFSVLDKDVAEVVITSELDPSMAVKSGVVSGPMV